MLAYGGRGVLTIRTLAAFSSWAITSGGPSAAAIMVSLQWRAMRCIMGAGAAAGQSPQRPRSLTRSQRPSQPRLTPASRPPRAWPGRRAWGRGKAKSVRRATSLGLGAPAVPYRARPGRSARAATAARGGPPGLRTRACVLSGAPASRPLQPSCPWPARFPPRRTHPAPSPGTALDAAPLPVLWPSPCAPRPLLPFPRSTLGRTSLGTALPISSPESAPPFRTSLSSAPQVSVPPCDEKEHSRIERFTLLMEVPQEARPNVFSRQTMASSSQGLYQTGERKGRNPNLDCQTSWILKELIAACFVGFKEFITVMLILESMLTGSLECVDPTFPPVPPSPLQHSRQAVLPEAAISVFKPAWTVRKVVWTRGVVLSWRLLSYNMPFGAGRLPGATQKVRCISVFVKFTLLKPVFILPSYK